MARAQMAAIEQHSKECPASPTRAMGGHSEGRVGNRHAEAEDFGRYGRGHGTRYVLEDYFPEDRTDLLSIDWLLLLGNQFHSLFSGTAPFWKSTVGLMMLPPLRVLTFTPCFTALRLLQMEKARSHAESF